METINIAIRIELDKIEDTNKEIKKYKQLLQQLNENTIFDENKSVC